MNEFQRLKRLAAQYKALYPKGTRVELLMMGSDPRPIEPGTRGTVDCVDDMGTIQCTFDNGRRLGIIPEEDSFRKLTEMEVLDESVVLQVDLRSFLFLHAHQKKKIVPRYASERNGRNLH